jgi:outer membrane protein insertion porin family
VDVRKKSKNSALSPLIVSFLAILSPLSLSQPSFGEISETQLNPAPSDDVSSYPQILVELMPQEEVTPTPINSEQKIEEIPVELMPQTSPTQEKTSDFSFVTLDTPEAEKTQASQPIPQSKGADLFIAQNPASEPRVLVAEIVVNQKTGVLDPEFERLVFNTIQTRPGVETTRTQLQADVNAVYETGLFADVTVIPEDTELGVRVTFQVEPNPVLTRVEVQHIPATTDKSVLPDEVVEEIFGDNYGEILNLRELQDDIKTLNQWYNDQGYDLAQVVGAPEISNDGVVTLLIAEGIVEDIKVRYFDENQEEVEGKTREFIITREVELKPGDIFNRNMAQRDLQRVFGLGLFDDVRLSFSPGEDPSKVVVNVDVVEGNTGSLAAGAGISSASGLFGTLSYQQKNLGGNNQTLGGEIQLGTRELLFDLRFTDPWIGGDPYRTSYTVDFFRRRSISFIFDGGEPEINLANGDRPRIVRTGGGLSFSRPYPANPFERTDWRFSTGLQYQRVEITDADGETTPFDSLGNALSFSDDGVDDLITLQLGASRDRRNSALQPTSGSLLRVGMEQTVPFGAGSILFNRVRGSYSYYIPVDYIKFSEGAQTIALNVQAGTIIGDLPPYEAFSLGGSNSIRGYEEGDVGSGRSYLQATAEYRFPLFSVIGGALFLDYGTDLGTGGSVPGNPAGARNKPGDAFGYGLGVRIQSPLGPIRVDYALNENGDSKVHFGIGERF